MLIAFREINKRIVYVRGLGLEGGARRVRGDMGVVRRCEGGVWLFGHDG